MSSDDKNNFINQTMLTCIGNKRKLVKYIEDILHELTIKLSKNKLNILDGFAGSVVVSRLLSYYSDNLYTNDLELYSYLMAKCYLETPTKRQIKKIAQHINTMNNIAINGPYIPGIITKLYAPKDTNNVKYGERCFYTHENALIIDTLRKYIDDKVEHSLQVYCLVPLLNKASIHANTSGVFKGFHKNNDIGCFGGKGKNALERIMKPITLDIPIWNEISNFKAHCYNRDINDLIDELPNNIDLIYLDPPYNQHPYGSNYFMLNLIATNEEPTNISNVSGIPSNWKKSNYNYRDTAIKSMKELIDKGLDKSKYILISYNDEGFINENEWKTLLNGYKIKKYEIEYDTYKGSRNLKDRSNKVFEIMYLISK
jgi:adenine-specific DNA-methyltransferase